MGPLPQISFSIAWMGVLKIVHILFLTDTEVKCWEKSYFYLIE